MSLKLYLDEVHQQQLPNKENEKKSTVTEKTSTLESDNLEFKMTSTKISAITESTNVLNEIEQNPERQIVHEKINKNFQVSNLSVSETILLLKDI